MMKDFKLLYNATVK